MSTLPNLDKLNISNEEATALAKHGGTLLCLDVPSGVQFGFDYNIWQTGEQFKGVKMIPPGLHLMVHQLGANVMLGTFLEFKQGDIIVKQWSAADEEFLPNSGSLSEDDVERYRSGVRRFDFDSGLAPYPFSNLRGWQACTKHMTKETLEQHGVSIGDLIVPGEELTELERTRLQDQRPDASRDAEAGTATGSNPAGSKSGAGSAGNHGVAPRFPDLTSKTTRRKEGMSPAQITQYNLDGTGRINDLIKQYYNGSMDQFLASVELSFILFISIHSLPAFEYWNAVVKLVCTCCDGLVQRPQLYIQFLQLLAHQLDLVDKELFSEEFLGNDVIVSSLTQLGQTFLEEGEDLDSSLCQVWTHFHEQFKRVFGIDITGLAELLADD